MDAILAGFMRALTAESDMSTPTEEAKQIQPRSSPEALMYRNSGSLQLPVFVEQRLHEVAETLLEQGAVWYDAGPHGGGGACVCRSVFCVLLCVVLLSQLSVSASLVVFRPFQE